MDEYLAGEAELDKHLERGYAKLDEWRDYWWTQRAYALREIVANAERNRMLKGYVKRCGERIDRPAHSAGAEPK